MIIPNSHSADLKTATETHLFELEAILRAAIKIIPLDAGKIRVSLNQHTSSFETQPHVHIHLFAIPSTPEYNDDILHQLRYLSRKAVSNMSPKHVARLPLTLTEKEDKALMLRDPFIKELPGVLSMNYQRFTLFNPQRSIRLKAEQRSEQILPLALSLV